MLICVCRRIDSDDFASEAELRARILDEDFQCGLCQMQYLISGQDTDIASHPTDGTDSASTISGKTKRAQQ